MGEVRVRDRLEWWEALLAELEDGDRLIEILQPVLAEVRRLDLGQLACLLRQQHLPTVSGRGDPCPQVHVLADVALL